MRKILLILSVFLPGKFRVLILNSLGYKVSLKAKLAPFSIILVKDVLIIIVLQAQLSYLEKIK